MPPHPGRRESAFLYPKGADVDFHRKGIRATKPLASQSASLPYRTEEKEVWDCAKCSSHRKDLGLRYSGSSSHHNDSLSLGAGAGRGYFGNLVIHSIKFYNFLHKNKGYKGQSISFKISFCIKQRGMGESFMIKQRGFVCFNLQINYSRENIDFQCLCSLVHKSVTSILIYQFISCIRR